MRKIAAVLLTCLLSNTDFLCAEQLNGGDDFNDNQKDPAKWAATDTTLFNGRLSESDSRLEFSVVNAATSIDLASRSWTRQHAARIPGCRRQWNLDRSPQAL